MQRWCEQKVNNFGKPKLATTLGVGNTWWSQGGSRVRKSHQAPLSSGCCSGQGLSGAMGLWLGRREGATWESSQDLWLRGSLCVPAAQSRRSWEPQRWIRDADKNINFAVQLQAPRRVCFRECHLLVLWKEQNFLCFSFLIWPEIRSHFIKDFFSSVTSRRKNGCLVLKQTVGYCVTSPPTPQ